MDICDQIEEIRRKYQNWRDENADKYLNLVIERHGLLNEIEKRYGDKTPPDSVYDNYTTAMTQLKVNMEAVDRKLVQSMHDEILSLSCKPG
jgi:hypothetical protein